MPELLQAPLILTTLLLVPTILLIVPWAAASYFRWFPKRRFTLADAMLWVGVAGMVLGILPQPRRFPTLWPLVGIGFYIAPFVLAALYAPRRYDRALVVAWGIVILLGFFIGLWVAAGF